MSSLLCRWGLAALWAVAAATPALADDATAPLETVIVTARLRPELAQDVPIALSTIDAATLARTNASNVSQLTSLLPSVNYSSPNPRNTAFTIRGLGSSVVAVSQANDGLEPGVGFYVDGVYHARPATAAFDFVDLERVEILRGPQGTLFGKNTTAGAIQLTSQAPTFTPEGVAEWSAGEFGLQQAKGALSGALIDTVVAGRLSAAVTVRDGVITHVTDGQRVNDIDNAAYRGQILIQAGEHLRLRIIGDYASVDGECCTQVYVTVAPTLKSPARQYASLAAGLHYAPPSLNPYDRLTDIDAPLGVSTNEGGVSVTADYAASQFSLTSISAWRFWNWDAANDRDYTGIPIQTTQHIPSRQDQYSQELRIASNHTTAIDWLAGLYGFRQTITGEPISEYGSAATYWLLGPETTNPATTYPKNLLTGYGTDGHTRYTGRSTAVFGEANWHATERLTATLGARYTDEQKDGDFASSVYGGLATTNARLLKAQLSILRPQAYSAHVADGSLSGRASVSFRWTPALMTYVSVANTQKSGGINMSGLPLNASNLPALNTAVVKPEQNETREVGFKSTGWAGRLTLNADAFLTEVRDFQTNVVDTGPGALRGYLANIDRVRVRGFEWDSRFVWTPSLALRASGGWTDARYQSYHNGPCSIEAIAASTTVCDLTGKGLAGIPHFALSAGSELTHPLSQGGLLFFNVDVLHRGSQYGDASDSAYTVLPAYDVVNAQWGWRGSRVECYLWVKNLGDRDYLQNVTVQAGNSGLIVGTPSDPRAAGLTLRARL